jgi:hypothetical protein
MTRRSGFATWKLSALALGTLFVLSCPQPPDPPTPTTYERIVIETFPSMLGNTTDTCVELFGSGGDPDADDPWAGNDTADAIAYDDNSSTHTWYSYIDYQEGLTSGTYYIRVRGKTIDTTGPYAIRALSLALEESLPAYDYPNVLAVPDPYEDDDSPVYSEGVPTNPLLLELGASKRLNRWLDYTAGPPEEGDVDWFELVLP